VCKYTGTPGVNETLANGQNPIAVSSDAVPGFNGTVGCSFNDAHGRSYVLALVVDGEPVPVCPAPCHQYCPVNPVCPWVQPAACPADGSPCQCVPCSCEDFELLHSPEDCARSNTSDGCGGLIGQCSLEVDNCQNDEPWNCLQSRCNVETHQCGPVHDAYCPCDDTDPQGSCPDVGECRIGYCDADTHECTADVCIDDGFTEGDCCDPEHGCACAGVVMDECMTYFCNFTTHQCNGGRLPVNHCCLQTSECPLVRCQTVACNDQRCEYSPDPECCTTDEQCEPQDACHVVTCVDGQCIQDDVHGEDPLCCTVDMDCDELLSPPNGTCKVRACNEQNQCEYRQRHEDCCEENSDCDDGDACTKDVCHTQSTMLCSHYDLPGCCDPQTEPTCGDADGAADCVEHECRKDAGDPYPMCHADLVVPCCRNDTDCPDDVGCTHFVCRALDGGLTRGDGVKQCVPEHIDGCCTTNKQCAPAEGEDDGDACTAPYCDVDCVTGAGECAAEHWRRGCCHTDADCDELPTPDACTRYVCDHSLDGSLLPPWERRSVQYDAGQCVPQQVPDCFECDPIQEPCCTGNDPDECDQGPAFECLCTVEHRCHCTQLRDTCVAHEQCDDGLECTVDRCNSTTAACEHEPVAHCCEEDCDCDDEAAAQCAIGTCNEENRCDFTPLGCCHDDDCLPVSVDGGDASPTPCIERVCLANFTCATIVHTDCCVGNNTSTCGDGGTCKIATCHDGKCHFVDEPLCCDDDGGCQIDDPCRQGHCNVTSGTCSYPLREDQYNCCHESTTQCPPHDTLQCEGPPTCGPDDKCHYPPVNCSDIVSPVPCYQFQCVPGSGCVAERIAGCYCTNDTDCPFDEQCVDNVCEVLPPQPPVGCHYNVSSQQCAGACTNGTVDGRNTTCVRLDTVGEPECGCCIDYGDEECTPPDDGVDDMCTNENWRCAEYAADDLSIMAYDASCVGMRCEEYMGIAVHQQPKGCPAPPPPCPEECHYDALSQQCTGVCTDGTVDGRNTTCVRLDTVGDPECGCCIEYGEDECVPPTNNNDTEIQCTANMRCAEYAADDLSITAYDASCAGMRCEEFLGIAALQQQQQPDGCPAPPTCPEAVRRHVQRQRQRVLAAGRSGGSPVWLLPRVGRRVYAARR
jgi:hypothetical protein